MSFKGKNPGVTLRKEPSTLRQTRGDAPTPCHQGTSVAEVPVRKGTRPRAPFVLRGSRGRAQGRRETKQKANHSKNTSLALQKPSAIICGMRITNLAQFSSHMLQDLVSLQLFYFKHPHDTKEFAIFFFCLPKFIITNNFIFLFFFFYPPFNSSASGSEALPGCRGEGEAAGLAGLQEQTGLLRM